MCVYTYIHTFVWYIRICIHASTHAHTHTHTYVWCNYVICSKVRVCFGSPRGRPVYVSLSLSLSLSLCLSGSLSLSLSLSLSMSLSLSLSLPPSLPLSLIVCVCAREHVIYSEKCFRLPRVRPQKSPGSLRAYVSSVRACASHVLKEALTHERTPHVAGPLHVSVKRLCMCP